MKEYKTFKKMSGLDSGFSKRHAKRVVAQDVTDNVIVKPLQYYLFDPIVHGAAKGVKVSAATCYSKKGAGHPRDV